MSKSKVSSSIHWENVCRMLEKVKESKNHVKSITLKKFVDKYKECLAQKSNKETILPILRLLLPELDRERGPFGVKEKRLSHLYIKVLSIHKKSSTAQRLTHFSKAVNGNAKGEDFADVACSILQSYCSEKGKLSLAEVDDGFTKISAFNASNDQAGVEKVLIYMIRNLSANEQKWFIRILLKQLKLGIGKSAIFDAWHPDAKKYYDITNNLGKVSADLVDRKKRFNEMAISIFSAFRPMLSERVVYEKLDFQLRGKSYFSEIKFDGERSQIHKNYNHYRYFSRNGFDFSSNFGKTPSDGIYTPWLHPLFKSHVKDIILDGEMMAWSQKRKSFVTKSENIDVKHLKEGGDCQACFCIFDVVYLNGKVLTNVPYINRIQYIEQVLTPLPGRLIFSGRTQIICKDDVANALNSAIERGEEGIVIKDAQSVYEPGTRNKSWIKIKPDYIDACVNDVDLIIIGGYYAARRRSNLISQFLLGYIESVNSSESKWQFCSVCRVTSGYTDAELEKLNALLCIHASTSPPTNVTYNKEKPDLWFPPQSSYVLQIRAAEITSYGDDRPNKSGFSFRFPRVEKVRFDKPWQDVATLEQLKQLASNFRGKVTLKRDTVKNKIDDAVVAKRRRCDKPALMNSFKPADTSRLQVKENIFNGLEYCVMEGDENLSKHELEMLLVQHGATITQNPGQSTHCVLCKNVWVRVQDAIDLDQNVVKCSWVTDCIEAGKVVGWNPLDVFHVRPKDAEKLSEEFDQFNDSFYEEITTPRLKSIFNQMKNEVQNIHSKEKIKIEKLINTSDTLRTLFSGIKVKLCYDESDHSIASKSMDESDHSIASKSMDESDHSIASKSMNESDYSIASKSMVLKLKLQLYGATLVQCDFTHVLHLHAKTCLNALLQSEVVKHINETWVENSIQQKKIME